MMRAILLSALLAMFAGCAPMGPQFKPGAHSAAVGGEFSKVKLPGGIASEWLKPPTEKYRLGPGDKTAHRLGIQSELQPNASLALGTSEVTPLELVTAYAPFANGGIGVQDHIILKVRSADGKLLYQRRATGNGRIVEPHYVAMMNRMLSEVLASGTGKKAELPGWQAAGKTGTSQDYRDAWFVGYTSHRITGVWLGNDDNSPTRKSVGGNLPVEVWNQVMKTAHSGVPPAALPSAVWQEPGEPPAAAPAPEAPVVAAPPPRPVQPLADNGAPLTINQAGQAIADKSAPATPSPGKRDPRALVPPAPIPAAPARAVPPAPKKGIFDFVICQLMTNKCIINYKLILFVIFNE